MAYIISSGESSEGLSVTNESIIVYSGGTANSNTLYTSAYLRIYSGGVANSTSVNNCGRLEVSSGGTANSTTVYTGGNLIVSSGGTANAIVENGGFVWFADEVVVTFVSNTLSGLKLTGYYQTATIHSGMTANSTSVSPGVLQVYSGGTANSTTVNSAGDLIVYDGGTANNTTVNSRGYLYVASGGTANNATVNFQGNMLRRSAKIQFSKNTLLMARTGRHMLVVSCLHRTARRTSAVLMLRATFPRQPSMR